MAVMDDSPLPLKRPRLEVPWAFIKDLELLDENLETAHDILLDIIDGGDKRELDLHKLEDIPIVVPSIDPRELFGYSSASNADAHGVRLEEIAGTSTESGARERSFVSLLSDDSSFRSFSDGLWTREDKENEKKVEDGSSQESGDHAASIFGNISHEENRADAVEAPAGCKPGGTEESTARATPLIIQTEEVVVGTFEGKNLDIYPSAAPGRLESEPVNFEAVPEDSRVPEARPERRGG